ncbi:hypothetical protein H072_510 [Dactylellina haptotyla CBS 200.50]|uniref:Nucleoside phosphorylase domain-containing protein n=1 Tax=Dactylellina haptotyla (strain CBS 200.50) TaxID=1284197 RepID=S8CCX7_DACHA|nr:hypothetical protein H072_510 [Dactylellina haptotyla CBS 200.50]
MATRIKQRLAWDAADSDVADSDEEPEVALTDFNGDPDFTSNRSLGKMPPIDSYTIGWLCALLEELTAARVFLDAEHDKAEYVSTNDLGAYTLGTIGKHNVAIGVLPKGECGTSAAAIAARDMVHSFPNVRVGLLVGIGGGAPYKGRDIRLGDVVVSTPTGGRGGVMQYDFGKVLQGAPFQPTGFLNQPPHILRAAVADLESDHEIYGNEIHETIQKLLRRYRNLQKKYQRPNEDRLYKSDFVHAPSNVCCFGFNDNPSNEVERSSRELDDEDPRIHYGLIASTNNVMKDAIMRDELVAKYGILCFETEAAGLMNHFPCLVIRGICSYSDSHQNTAWQGYAAMTAAAYAKSLLCKLAPRRVAAQTKIEDLPDGN